MYYYTQSLILDLFSYLWDFPEFDLEELLLNIPETYTWIISQDPYNVFIFFIVGGILFYITTFIMEIGLAKLADTGSLRSAFNLKSINESINTYGWKNYVLEYTSILLAIVILSYLGSIEISFFWIDHLIDTFFGFLIFATQYLGIGAVYSRIKDIEQNR